MITGKSQPKLKVKIGKSIASAFASPCVENTVVMSEYHIKSRTFRYYNTSR